MKSYTHFYSLYLFGVCYIHSFIELQLYYYICIYRILDNCYHIFTVCRCCRQLSANAAWTFSQYLCRYLAQFVGKNWPKFRGRFSLFDYLLNILCMAAMLFGKTQHLAERSSQHLYAIMSFSYVGAMLASNYALQYISYPAQVITLYYSIFSFLFHSIFEL